MLGAHTADGVGLAFLGQFLGVGPSQQQEPIGQRHGGSDPQIDVIGALRKPIAVLTSTDDKALKVSEKLAGDVARLGNVEHTDPRMVEMVNARKGRLLAIDLSKENAPDKLGHSKFLLVMPQLEKLARDRRDDPLAAQIQNGGLYVFDAARGVLELPARISDRIR